MAGPGAPWLLRALSPLTLLGLQALPAQVKEGPSAWLGGQSLDQVWLASWWRYPWGGLWSPADPWEGNHCPIRGSVKVFYCLSTL